MSVSTRMIGPSAALITAMLGCAFLGAGVIFAYAQQVWIDETTQLAGAVLPFGRMIAWLAGAHDPSVAVPPDRAPPLSYIVDWTWCRAIGYSPIALRFLHLGIVFAGTSTMLVALARRRGAAAMIGAAIILYLSPKLVEYAVELRPYALFLSLTCVQVVALVDLVERAQFSRRRLAIFAALSVMAAYSHFYGLVSSIALFGGLFITRGKNLRDGAAIVVAMVGMVMMSAGLSPFVAGANSISQMPLPPPGIGDVGLFVMKLVGQPVTFLVTPLAVAFYLAFAIILCALVVRVIAMGHQRPWGQGSAEVALLIALVAGLGMPIAATVLPHGFDPLKPTYSLWVLPLLAWLVGNGCAVDKEERTGSLARLMVATVRLATAVMALASAVIQILLVSYAPWFAHGPGDAIAAAIGKRSNGIAVVYRGEWGYGYFPSLWRYGTDFPQWLRLPDGTYHRLTAATIDPVADGIFAPPGTTRIVLADITPRRYSGLRPLLHGAAAAEAFGRLAPPPGFRFSKRVTWPGLYWTTITVYRRTP